MGAGRAGAGCRDEQGQAQAQASSAAMYFLLSTLHSKIYGGGCGAVRCGYVACGCAMGMCAVMYSIVWGAGGRRGARAGGSHPWIWGAPQSRGLHDLEVAVVLLVIGAAQHHRRAHGPPKEDHSRPVTLAPCASSMAFSQHLDVQTSNPCRHRSTCAKRKSPDPRPSACAHQPPACKQTSKRARYTQILVPKGSISQPTHRHRHGHGRGHRHRPQL